MKIIADEQLSLLRRWIPESIELIQYPSTQITHEACRDADALIVRSVTRVNAELLRESRVRFVSTASAGHDHIESDALAKLDIGWASQPGCNAVSVAEYVLSCIAAGRLKGLLPQRKLTMAIVGVGHVGRAVLDKCRPWCSAIYLIDPPRAEREPNFISENLDDLPDVDVIALHTPLTFSGPHPTEHLINRERLLKRRAGTFIISAGRGGVVDTEAAMMDGQHVTWCLDVFEDEPSVSPSFIQQAFIATPHIAGHAIQAKWRAAWSAAKAVADWGNFSLLENVATPLPHPDIDARSARSWEELVLMLRNPLPLTQTMKQFPAHFTQLRQQYTTQHEFGFMDVHVTPELQPVADFLRNGTLFDN